MKTESSILILPCSRATSSDANKRRSQVQKPIQQHGFEIQNKYPFLLYDRFAIAFTNPVLTSTI